MSARLDDCPWIPALPETDAGENASAFTSEQYCAETKIGTNLFRSGITKSLNGKHVEWKRSTRIEEESYKNITIRTDFSPLV